MKTTLLTILGLVLVITANAQNWEILNTNKTYFYRHSDSLHVGNVIHIDSIFIDGSSETFYTAYKYKKCDTCTVYPEGTDEYSTTLIYRYAPEFLGFDIMLDLENELYSIDNNVIRNHSEVGETWDFSSITSATTISLGQAELFGELDSIKTIVLSTNDTIILSQSKGLIRYPDFENDGKYYELGGYHEGQNSYGEYAPNFWSTYDFEVGDKFCLHSSYAAGGDWGWYYDNYQMNILENLNGNTMISYQVHILKEHIFPGEFNAMYSYENFIDTLTVNYSDYSMESFFGVGEGVFPSDNSVFYGSPFDEDLSFVYGDWNEVVPVSRIHYSEEYGLVKTVMDFKLFGDSILYKHYNTRNTAYANNYGRILDIDNGFEWFYEEYLAGALIAGDTIGDFCDFPIDLGVESLLVNPLSIHPNPATTQITIGGSYEILEIFSQTGQLVMKIENPTSVIDVSDLSPGIYFIKAASEEKLYTAKLIIE